jgi:hypothetical protein
MKKIILILLATLLSAKNPIIYSALGDVIYNNVDKIQSLKDINKYESEFAKIVKYVDDVKIAKSQGFAIEDGNANIDKIQYLDKLRDLSKINDYFVRSANQSFMDSLKSQDNVLFSQMINCGLVDNEANKEKIIDYYFAHTEDIHAFGVIQNYLNEDLKLKKAKEAQKKLYKSKKMKEEEKIKRIRERDQAEQAKLEKKLDDEVKSKKLQIRNEQKSELFR